MEIPAQFCWTRFGTESGMSIGDIVRQKQLQQQAAGLFCWGIGNALGNGINELRKRQHAPVVVFSAMASRAAPRDVRPEGVVAWRAYRGESGAATPLPPGIVVISRVASTSGHTKKGHYVLFCRSDELPVFAVGATIKFGHLRNIITGNLVGAQQTTAVVTVNASGTAGRVYAASLVAHLVPPYYAQVADPVALSAADIQEIIASTDDPAAWFAKITQIRARPPVSPEVA
jgi:hypothetical protein